MISIPATPQIILAVYDCFFFMAAQGRWTDSEGYVTVGA
jgi:hypothetical protein